MKKNINKKTKIFCDTADFNIIKKMGRNNLVDGFTTNPSLMKLSGAKNYEKYAKKLLKASNNKPISFEVFSDNHNEMEKQAYKINSWGSNIYVKIPVTNSRGKFSGNLIRKLSNKKIKLNITAVYTVKQVKDIFKCLNKNSYAFISIFCGRMADVGKDPLPIVKRSISITKKNKKVKILWASTREIYNFTQAKECGCHIITMPPKIIEKISKFGKTFETLTLETVKTFYKDAVAAKFRI